jgi:hypothetical protein
MSGASAEGLDARIGWSIFLVFAGAYLALTSREPPWGDAQIMFAVAEAIVERGEFALEYLWPPMSHRGVGGVVYSQYSLLPSIVHLPGAFALEIVGPRHHAMLLPLAAQFGPSACAAAGCSFFFLLCRRLEIRRPAAVVGAVVLGTATMVAVYARRPFSEACQVASILLYVLMVVRFDADRTRRGAIWVGVTAGLLINAKLVYVLTVAGTALVVLSRGPDRLRWAGWAGLGATPMLVALLGYNWIRWGSPLDTGYAETLELQGESPFWGVFGLALSTGKSIFLYNPPLVLSVIVVGGFARNRPRAVLVLGAAVLPAMIYYGSFLNWGGGWCWGPRYWTFAVPFLLLPSVWWIDAALSATRPRRRRALVAFVGLALLGSGVQFLGSVFYWDHFIRIGRRIQAAWLGEPDRSGAVIDEAGRGHCDSCIEDTYSLLWLPQMQPIVGHAWLLRHAVLDDSWTEAREDAPWRRHTRIDFQLEKSYGRAKLDWWPLDLQRGDRRLAFGCVGVFALIALAGGGLGVRELRRVRRRGGDELSSQRADEPAG